MFNTFARLAILPLALVASFASASKTERVTVEDSHHEGMTKISYEIDMNASKEKVWGIVADYGNLDWTDGVERVDLINDIRQDIGMTRRCYLPGDKYVVERITQWSEGSGYTYVIDDISDPIKTTSYVNWSVSEKSGVTTVGFEIHYEMEYGLLGDILNSIAIKRKFPERIGVFMKELKAHAET